MTSRYQMEDRAALQHGVFSVADARASGMTDPAMAYRTATGRYKRMYPGVLAISGSPATSRQRMAAAVQSFPALAAISHQTAAEMWGMTRRGIRTVEIVTTRWDRVRRPDLKVHESLDLIAEDVVDVDGIATTTPARTVVDLGASNKWPVESALEQGIRLELFSVEEVEAMVARVARRGRRGVGVIRPLLKARRRWDLVTESFLEDSFVKVIHEGGLPKPRTQYTVRDAGGGFVCRADFAYPESMLLIELDSEAHHLDRMTFRGDRSKQNKAVVLGWTVLRYTWWDLQERPWHVRSEVRSALGPPA